MRFRQARCQSINLRNITGRTFPLAQSIAATPLTDVASLPRLSARLFTSDEVLARYITASNFSSFTRQANRGMIFTKADDVDIPAVKAAADTYSVTVMHYNLEWPAHTWDQIRDQLILTRAALIAAGDTRPLIFGPLKFYLDTHIADYAPSCDGFAWQLQAAASLSLVPALAQTAVTSSHAQIADCPVYVQINAYDEGALAIENCVRALSKIDGVTGVNLFFGGAANWAKCFEVIKRLRPA